MMLLNHSRYIAAGLHYQYTDISFPFRKHETRYFLPVSDLLPPSGNTVVFTVGYKGIAVELNSTDKNTRYRSSTIWDFYLRTSPRCSSGLLEKELSFRLRLVVLVALTCSAFYILDTFTLLLNLQEIKLVLPNRP